MFGKTTLVSLILDPFEPWLYRAETRQTKGLFRLKCVKLIAIVWRSLAHLNRNNSGGSATARAEPEEERASPATATAVTIAVAGTAPQAGETPPPATETPRQAVRMKRAIKKKSVL
jgi:hypothetical protein